MPGKRMRAEAKMVEIPTCSVVECRVWSVEAGGASNMQPPFFISHVIFFISHFSFLILDFRFPRVSAFRQTPPSTRLGNRGQSCLSTDRRRADFPDLTPTQPGRLHASPHCRFVKLSDHICPPSRKAAKPQALATLPTDVARAFFITFVA